MHAGARAHVLISHHILGSSFPLSYFESATSVRRQGKSCPSRRHLSYNIIVYISMSESAIGQTTRAKSRWSPEAENHTNLSSRGNDHIPSGQPKPLETPLKKTHEAWDQKLNSTAYLFAFNTQSRESHEPQQPRERSHPLRPAESSLASPLRLPSHPSIPSPSPPSSCIVSITCMRFPPHLAPHARLMPSPLPGLLLSAAARSGPTPPTACSKSKNLRHQDHMPGRSLFTI